MYWRKIGKIFEFNSSSDKTLTHASNPLPIKLSGDVYRVYYSSRDKFNRSSVAYVDIDLSSFNVISKPSPEVFCYGASDSFYSHGVSIGNSYKVDGQELILFMGWQLNGDEHWRGDIGALRHDLDNIVEPLTLFSNEPMLTSDQEDPISLSYPWVMEEDGVFKMWYGSTIDWSSENGEMIHVIKYATSTDGLNWNRLGIAVPYEIGKAQAFSRPTVIKLWEQYYMWFSYRSGDGTKYRIGHATSLDGLAWTRSTTDDIDVGPEGEWDSEMICYPYVFKHKSEVYMMYNGNAFGESGFGLAVLETEE